MTIPPPRRPRRCSWNVVAAAVRTICAVALLALVAWPARHHTVIVWDGGPGDSYAACTECGWNETVPSDSDFTAIDAASLSPEFDMTYDEHVEDSPGVVIDIVRGSSTNPGALVPLVGGG